MPSRDGGVTSFGLEDDRRRRRIRGLELADVDSFVVPEICPNCGADVPPRARACPECGSCPETGWSEEADIGALGLPDEEFDYEEYVRREFGGRPRGGRGGVVAVVLGSAALILVVLWLFLH